MISFFLVVLLILLTLGSAFASGCEISLFSLSPMTVRSYRLDKDPRKRLIANLVNRPRELFVTLFSVNITVNILLQNTSSVLFSEGGWVLQIGVPLVVTLVFGEIIPKYIAMNNNAVVAYFVAPTVAVVERLVAPIRRFVLALAGPISRLMFFFLKKESDISREELHHVLKTSEAYGVLNRQEADLVNGYLDLQEAVVKELMQPREDVLAYDIQDPLSTLVSLFADKELSRVPVCDGDLQTILGIMHSLDYFLNRDIIQSPADLRPHLHKPFFVPESSHADQLFTQLDERDEETALVVDEYGNIVGLITREDLVEVVIGEIADRRDESASYTSAGENVIIASGKLELAEFEEIFGVPLESSNNMVTVSGWLIEQMGSIPKSGAKYQTPQFLFQVLAADPNRIRRIYIRKLPDVEEKR